MSKGRLNLGLPDWDTVSYWLNEDRVPSVYREDVKMGMILKNEEIVELEDYDSVPEDKFWENFPYRGLPDKCHTSVNKKTA